MAYLFLMKQTDILERNKFITRILKTVIKVQLLKIIVTKIFLVEINNLS